MKRLLIAIIIIATFIVTFGETIYAAEFNDVSPQSSAYKAITALVEAGIIRGYADGEFKPNNAITRAEFATIMCRALGGEAIANSLMGVSYFDDVSTSHWASGYIVYGFNTGIINGMGDGTFMPESSVTYEQVIKMVVASLGKSQVANERGGYPNGYLSIGHELGLDYNTNGQAGCLADRATVAQIIYNGGFADRYDTQVPIASETPIPIQSPLPEPEPPQEPQIYPESGDFDEPFEVSAYSYGDDNDIYYTLDGSTPTINSIRYNGTIRINKATTLKAIAVDSSGEASSVVTCKYRLTKYERLEAKCEEIIDEVIVSGMSDVEKEKAIHDWIVQNCRYDIDNFEAGTIPAESYTAYGLLVNGMGVCQSYAAATEMLLVKVGIDTMIISGEGDGIGGWGGHAWNIVKIDGKYYHLDVTWDDPIPDGQLRYDYFNVSDRTMRGDHRWENERDYPACDNDMNSDEMPGTVSDDDESDEDDLPQPAGLDVTDVPATWFDSLPTGSLVSGAPFDKSTDEYTIVVFGRVSCGNTTAYIPRANEIIGELNCPVKIVFYDVDQPFDDVKEYLEDKEWSNVTAYTGGNREMWNLLRACGVDGSVMFPVVAYVRNGKVINAAIEFQNAASIEAAILNLISE